MDLIWYTHVVHPVEKHPGYCLGILPLNWIDSDEFKVVHDDYSVSIAPADTGISVISMAILRKGLLVTSVTKGARFLGAGRCRR